MPALSALQARQTAHGLTADDIEAIIDRLIAKEIERSAKDFVLLTDRCLGAPTTVIWTYVANNGAGFPILDEVISRYRAAGYGVTIEPAPAFKRDGLDTRKHCIRFSWAAPMTMAMALASAA